MTTQASTREAYGKTLVELGHEDPDIVVLGGDLNKSTMTTLFAAEFPDRFFDCGAAEQNMMSIAAGLAASGKTVFASTFTVFGTGRPFDQVRIGISQGHLNVKIVTTHGGIITGPDGMSAHGIEDLALMCALPGFTVVVPADAVETVEAVRAMAAMQGPCYVRLCRPATPVIYEDGCSFQLGKAQTLRNGGDVSVLATGIMVSKALEAAETLSEGGIDCRVVNVSTLKPMDEETILRCAEETGAIVTAEEHLDHGGLGSIVSRILAVNLPTPMSVVAIDDVYTPSGEPDELLELRGLTPARIAEAARGVVARK